MQARTLEEAPAGNAGLREGALANKILMAGKEGSKDNYTVGLTKTVGGYLVPRHHHNFDQVRYFLEGETTFGKYVLRKGWVGYFPEGVYYGPQERSDGSCSLVLQFGGATGYGYLSRPEQKAARLELEKRGKFEKGAYTWVDEKGQRHNKDAFEAVYEQAVGQKCAYPPPRYEDIIVMNSENYHWVADPHSPGVFHKWLGAFGERQTRVGVIRVDAGATLTVGLHDARETMAVIKGEIAHDGRSYPLYSGFGIEPQEGPIALKAVEETELFCLQLPKF
jgi:hypothetical protein